MVIDRRDFIASATLVCVAPAIHLLPSQQPSSAAKADEHGVNQSWQRGKNRALDSTPQLK